MLGVIQDHCIVWVRKLMVMSIMLVINVVNVVMVLVMLDMPLGFGPSGDWHAIIYKIC